MKYYSMRKLLENKVIKPGNFLKIVGWDVAIVHDIDYEKEIIELMFKADGIVYPYGFSNLKRERARIMKEYEV